MLKIADLVKMMLTIGIVYEAYLATEWKSRDDVDIIICDGNGEGVGFDWNGANTAWPSVWEVPADRDCTDYRTLHTWQWGKGTCVVYNLIAATLMRTRDDVVVAVNDMLSYHSFIADGAGNVTIIQFQNFYRRYRCTWTEVLIRRTKTIVDRTCEANCGRTTGWFKGRDIATPWDWKTMRVALPGGHSKNTDSENYWEIHPELNKDENEEISEASHVSTLYPKGRRGKKRPTATGWVKLYNRFINIKGFKIDLSHPSIHSKELTRSCRTRLMRRY